MRSVGRDRFKGLVLPVAVIILAVVLALVMFLVFEVFYRPDSFDLRRVRSFDRAVVGSKMDIVDEVHGSARSRPGRR
jgi:hypothetical protein